MGSVFAIGVVICLHGSAAQGEVRTFYLSHVQAESLPDVLDQVVRQNVEWARPLQPHWQALKGSVTADAAQNAVKAEGTAEQLQALAQVIKTLDVPRPQVELKYQHVHVPDPTDLLGKQASLPMGEGPSPGHGDAPDARLSAGDWEARVSELVAAGKAEVLQEGRVSVIDTYWATVYLGDPETAEPDFCLQVRPVAMADGSLWLSLAYGTLRRTGRDPEPTEAGTGRGTPGEVCVNCGPGVGVMVLVPELVVTTRVQPGQSVLAGGAKWALEDAGGLQAPPEEWVVVSAVVEEAPKTGL